MLRGFDKKQKCENFIKCAKCADDVIIEITDGEKRQCILHIFEFKKTMDQSKWQTKVKLQQKYTYINCLALIGMLGLDLMDTIFYTAYSNDKFAEWKNTEDYDQNLLMLRAGYGSLAKGRPLPPKYEWEHDVTKFDLGEPLKFKHKRVKLGNLEADINNGVPSANLAI